MNGRFIADRELLEKDLKMLEVDAFANKDKEKDIQKWVSLIRDNIGIKKLDRNILGMLVDKIIIYERRKNDECITQQIDIHYRFIGNISNCLLQK